MDTMIKPGSAEGTQARPAYQPHDIEPKWQQQWEASGMHHANDDDPRPKYYNLVMFPYPSGDLHIGHWYNFVGGDVHGRLKRQQGYNVMEPIGFDAFGLPAENAAIKRGVQAHAWTLSNMDKMRQQLKMMGNMWDWDREVASCLPDYYKWTQWFFLKLYEQGLAYRAKAPVNWCPKDQTVLANEQVLANGTCERCGTIVIKRELEQWFFRITQYADRLLEYNGADWPEETKTVQRNWIGRSEGAKVNFKATAPDGQTYDVPVFTTRPDTIYGVTFFLLAPEHPLVEKLTAPDKQAEVQAYVQKLQSVSDIERQTDKEKTGVWLGSYVTNPVSGAQVPVWITDYVLMGYGTGAVMGVPAHDQRDFEFARKFGLEVIPVYQPDNGPEVDGANMTEALIHEGHVVNSGQFNGLPDSQETVKKFIDYLAESGVGQAQVTYRLRDWLISRQRYWGAPIPMVYCEKDGIVAVPEKDLPVHLPEDVNFQPSGESPLNYIPEFLNTTCPKCGGPARRETDTLDTFMCSSWYFLRYPNPHDSERAFDPELIRKWMPVDQYTGGPEHRTLHLLYARFFTMALYDMGLIDFQEPFTRLYHQGMILSEGRKMSKSRGNVVAPDKLISQYGVDVVRAFLLFLGPYDQGGNWNASTEAQIGGIQRFLSRVWSVTYDTAEAGAANGTGVDAQTERGIRRIQHKAIGRVIEDLENFSFNTALSGLMEYNNALIKTASDNKAVLTSPAWREAVETLLVLVSPICPHIAEELWHVLGHTTSVHNQGFPTYNPALAADDAMTLIVQINGKVRDKLEVPAGLDEEAVKATVLGSPKVVQALAGATPKKVITVPGKLVNIVL